MAEDLRSLERELQALLFAKAERIANRHELHSDYHAQRINGAIWLKRERELEDSLTDLHVKISALEARIAIARDREASEKGPST